MFINKQNVFWRWFYDKALPFYLYLLALSDEKLILEIINVIKEVAEKVNKEQGECQILTNLGNYQDSKHLHFHICAGKRFKK